VKLTGQNPKWEAEKAALRPLPEARFNGARYKESKVNRYSMVQLETNCYFVPAAYVGEKVTLKISADKVAILSKNSVIAIHFDILIQIENERLFQLKTSKLEQ